MNELCLIRVVCTPTATIGRLMVDNQFFCYTIEPPVVPNASHPKGAIPMGWYRLTVTYSPKFERELPLLNLVQCFTGIRIHAGNRVEHTAGCILVGEMPFDPESVKPRQEYTIYSSRRTETLLTSIIKDKLRNGEVYIHIVTRERLIAELHPNAADADHHAYRL